MKHNGHFTFHHLCNLVLIFVCVCVCACTRRCGVMFAVLLLCVYSCACMFSFVTVVFFLVSLQQGGTAL